MAVKLSEIGPLRPILSRMSTSDLWGMCDHNLNGIGLYRSWTTRSALFGTNYWSGVPGGWRNQSGRVVMSVNLLNQTEPQYQRACPECLGDAKK